MNPHVIKNLVEIENLNQIKSTLIWLIDNLLHKEFTKVSNWQSKKSNKNYTSDSIKNEFISFIFEQKEKKKLYSYRRNSQELLD